MEATPIYNIVHSDTEPDGTLLYDVLGYVFARSGNQAGIGIRPNDRSDVTLQQFVQECVDQGLFVPA